jgi:diaminopimelate decarboxylase
MKPLGPSRAFAAQQGDLCIAGQRAADLARPMARRCSSMTGRAGAGGGLARGAARAVALHYAVKANPFGPLLALMAGLVDGFDIASGGELALIRRRASIRRAPGLPGRASATRKSLRRLPPG